MAIFFRITFTRQTCLAVAAALAGFAWPGDTLAVDKNPGAINFVRDIRPLLSDNCFACHGPDAKQRKADLRLDTREGALADLDGTSAVVPGKPNESELARRITSDDEDDRMPPPDSGKQLDDRQKELLRQWIAQGAEYDLHWAYKPVTRPEVPSVNNGSFVRNDIDRFVLATMQDKGYAPAREADRRTLIRRLSFDLTGLPPTWERVQAFAADRSPRAFEKLVDRLLASPHYGERMAVFWLDLVRYADTMGYHSDNVQTKPLYREYVINAFNDNLAFDQFTREQLAGDLMPGATRRQLIASGYNRLNMTTREGGSQPKEYIAIYLGDRVRNVSGVWMATTLGCTECHDHKFDPFTSRDFYSLGAYFADLEETPVGPQKYKPLPTAAQQAEVDESKKELPALEAVLNTQTPALDDALAKWEAAQVKWTVLEPSAAAASNGTGLAILDDRSILASGELPDVDTYTVTFKDVPAGTRVFRIEALPDDSLPKKGPGRAGNGNFVITEVIVKAGDQIVPLQNATASFEQTLANENNPYKKWTAGSAIDGAAKGASFGWAVLPKVGVAQRLVFEASKALGARGELAFILKQAHGTKHTLGRFKILATAHAGKVTAESAAPPKKIGEILAVPLAKRSDGQKKTLATHYRAFAPELADARKKLADLKARIKQLEKAFPTSLISVRLAKPRTVRILPRGNWQDDSGPVVQPSVPARLNPANLEGLASRSVKVRAKRSDLADWVVSRKNPLTARVMVNRLWALCFGRGLATPLDDFGAQGTPPTHPELLDWLAADFMDHGWDIKRTLKLLVISGAYRQSSTTDAETMDADPLNKWLARQGRWRLDAEMVRDNALAVSGLLAKPLGGASVKPYQPAGYWKHLNFPKRKWSHDGGTSQYRRGLYTFWCRTFLHPSMLAFDAPTREGCIAERTRSNIPQQALVLLNDPTYVEAARVFAERIVRHGGDTDAERLAWAFERALTRGPSAAERDILLRLAKERAGFFAANAGEAKAAAPAGEWPVGKMLKPERVAVWAAVSRAILNLYETTSRF